MQVRLWEVPLMSLQHKKDVIHQFVQLHCMEKKKYWATPVNLQSHWCIKSSTQTSSLSLKTFVQEWSFKELTAFECSTVTGSQHYSAHCEIFLSQIFHDQLEVVLLQRGSVQEPHSNTDNVNLQSGIAECLVTQYEKDANALLTH